VQSVIFIPGILLWIPIVPNMAFFKVTLRYPYTVHLVAAKMKIKTTSSIRLALDGVAVDDVSGDDDPDPSFE
jgi:hypothetical protein